VATLHQVLEEPPPPPRQLNPEIPSDLEIICVKCLAKEPKGRYALALELAEALDQFRRSEAQDRSPRQEAVHARRAGWFETAFLLPWGRLGPWFRRRLTPAPAFVRAILARSAEGIVALDEAGRAVRCNSAAVQALGAAGAGRALVLPGQTF